MAKKKKKWGGVPKCKQSVALTAENYGWVEGQPAVSKQNWESYELVGLDLCDSYLICGWRAQDAGVKMFSVWPIYINLKMFHSLLVGGHSVADKELRV